MNTLENLLRTLSKPLYDDESEKDISIKERFENRLVELGISQFQAQKLLNIERKSMTNILEHEAKRVDILNALKISQFLNLKTEKFIEQYVSEMSIDAISDLEKAKKRTFIVNNFNINKLHSLGIIQTKNDFDKIEKRLNDFFGIKSIFSYEEETVFPLFSRTKRNSNEKMRDFWIKSAYTQFKQINNSNNYNRDALVELTPKIKPYTTDINNGFFTVAQALYHIGITVIYQPSLSSVQVRGATFSVNNKPCIVITDLWKNYPTLWFTLIHEIYHILYDFEEIKKTTYHLSDEYDLFLSEEKANKFAEDYFFSEEKQDHIKPLIGNHLVVKDYAKRLHIHPSIIYGIHCFKQPAKMSSSTWKKYRLHIPKTDETIKQFNTNPWKKNTLSESSEIIKETIYNI